MYIERSTPDVREVFESS